MHVVILGNGPAAVTAAETLRAQDPACRITQVSRETVPYYSPCPLAEYVEASVAREHLFLRDEAAYTRARIDTRWGEEARALDPARRRVTIAAGGREWQLGFDRLLIATGARAIVPPIPGLRETPGVFALKTLADAEGILARLARARRAVVIGSGFIGLEAAQALARRGVSVVVVEALGQVLPQMLDPDLAGRVQRRLEEHGVTVRLRAPAEAVVAGPGGVSAVRAGGEELPCELVVCAAGVRPDVSWLIGSGVATATGVLVDAHMETSAPGVFAAGDVVEARDVAGRLGVIANWPNAVNGGRIAGLNLAGVREPFRGLDAVNVVRVFGRPVSSFGSRQGERTLSVETDEGVRRLTLAGGRIVGGQFLGDVNGAGVYLELMNKGVEVEALGAELLSSSFGLGALLPRPPLVARWRA